MKLLLPTIILVLIATTSLSAQQNTINLFNGKNLEEWRVLNGFAEFKVEDSTIVGITTVGTPSTYLATKQIFTNFILEYEIKLDEGVNSGVQIRSQYDVTRGKHSVFGPQIDAEFSTRGWNGGIYDQSRNKWRYTTEYNPEVKSAWHNKGWNRVKVVALGNRIATWINGVNIANLVEEQEESGFIALQVHAAGKDKAGKTTKWRNIKLTEISENYNFGTTAPVISYLKNTLTKEEKNDGWELLWDGKTTLGWQGVKQNHFPKQGWRIEDGILKVKSSNIKESAECTDIITARKFKNFILELDFKFTKSADSGIKYFVNLESTEDDKSVLGCEFQIIDDRLHPDAKKGVKGNRSLGSLYDLIPANAKVYLPSLKGKKYVNQYTWNRARIVVNGNKVTHFLNGSAVVKYERNTQMWAALVAKSKFAYHSNFADIKEGAILLQNLGDEVHFKNIKIKELD